MRLIANGSVLLLLAVLSPSARGLWVDPQGTVMLDNEPYRAIGINYFSAFQRRLRDAGDRSYRAGFEKLGDKKIPYARRCCQ